MSLGALAATVAAPTQAAAPPRPRVATGRPPTAAACIVLYMHGGVSHIDTFDPKPGRDSGGPFAALPTAVPGLHMSEHLPGLVARAERLAVIRSMTAKEGNHDRARYLMHTGYAPVGTTGHPALGAMVAAQPRTGTLPGYVAIGGGGHSAGFLGPQYGPFVVPNPTRPVRYLQESSLSTAQRHARADLWRGQQNAFARHHQTPQVRGHTDVIEQTLAMMDSPNMAAFDLQTESDATRGRYGDGRFGQGCLLARRLVSAGVPFVEVGMKGWDTHEDNFDRVQRLSLQLDQAMSALLDDLASEGMAARTLVLLVGDFGRSPRINGRGGRDHHPRASSVVVAGGGLTCGQVIGQTDEDGDRVVDSEVTVPDLMRTAATALALDPDHARVSPGGRPLTTVDGGALVPGLLPR